MIVVSIQIHVHCVALGRRDPHTAAMTAFDRHLDLGCGEFPRNPYDRPLVCGIDIRALGSTPGFEYRAANLVLEPIPYADAHFASVSAYNFIEHIPRVMVEADRSATTFPFIRLMQEIWRVLEPGGRFYAVTPAFPHPEAFADPTHVNIITDTTHEYFCGERPLGHMYGFQGRFEVLRIEWTHFADACGSLSEAAGSRRRPTAIKRLAHGIRGLLRQARGKPAAGRMGFLVWELQAIKPPGG